MSWIAVDWGTSSLRAWAVDTEGQETLVGVSDRGMGSLAREEFEPTLLALIEPHLGDDTTKVVACGMVGAKQGWVEAPYATTPCAPQAGVIKVADTDPRIDVNIISGVSQAKPADVMRGEETQIAGFLRLNPEWDGIICLPGTHTKWVHISAGEIVSFQTFMTGEMFALLSTQSVLKHSVTSDGWDQEAFNQGVDDALSRPEAMAARLFSLRASSLLDGMSNDTGKSRLSGLLIGAELAASRPYWLGQDIALIGADTITDGYADALIAQGCPVMRTDAEHMTLAGLKAAYAQLKDSE